MNSDLLYSDQWAEPVVGEAKKLAGPILIVGASGFIGAKMFFNLRKHREDVFGCARYLENSWRFSNLRSSQLLSLDIADYDRVKSVILHLKPRTVFNMSAYGGYARQKDVDKIHLTNYIGTLNLIRALSETGCDAFVQSGSSSEYGLNSAGPSEDDELIPNSDYAVSKVGASYLIKYYGRVLQFPCVNLRLNSIYGPWEERDRLIPTLIANCLQGRLPKLVDRQISRDFVYIDDCTAAFVKAALTACKTHPGQSINIASGIKTTLESVARTAKRVFAVHDEPVFGSMVNRGWDLPDWYGNPALAARIMGWQCTTSFEEGLRLTGEWEKEAAETIKNVTISVKPKKISAIIACYKDNQAIPVLHERLTNVFKKTGNDYEIIFVNDGSPYNDEEVIAGLSRVDSHVIGISHSRNFGSQSAFLSGMDVATGDAVVLMDGDGQDPPEVIPEFIKKWEEGHDIVYGIRTKREATVPMQFFFKLFYRIFKKLANIDIPVDAGDFSLIDRKAVAYLLTFTEKDVFLRGLRAWIGFRQTGVPYFRPERLFGTSTNSFFKNIWWAKKAIFSFSMKPLQYIQAIGFVTFTVTVLLAAFYLVNYFLHPPSDAKGVTTIVLIMLGLGSIQIISTSILGDYIGKITEEVKNRPKFIRSKILYNGDIYDSDSKMRDFMKEVRKYQAH
jgi:polyisoprenyl-phosphate glycosyltransferase